MDVKSFPKTTRSAFAAGLVASLAAACAPNPNGLGVADFGTVVGRVVDTQSRPISGATISIGNVVAITAVADAGGFVLRNVPAGTQQLNIRAIGWAPYTGPVSVSKDQTSDVGLIALVSSIGV